MVTVNLQTHGITPAINSDANRSRLLSSAKNLDSSLQTVYQFISCRRQPIAVKSMKISEQSWKLPVVSPVCSVFQKCYMPISNIRVKIVGSPEHIVTEEVQPSPEVGVGVFILKDNKILIGRRSSVSVAANIYSIPGGHLEPGESYEECAAREVKEETGLDINNIKIINTNNLYNYHGTNVSVTYMTAHLSNPNQTPRNVEPDKCDGWEWYDLNDLPEPMFEPLREMIQAGFNPFLI